MWKRSVKRQIFAAAERWTLRRKATSLTSQQYVSAASLLKSTEKATSKSYVKKIHLVHACKVAKVKHKVVNFSFWRPYLGVCLCAHYILYTCQVYWYSATRWVVKDYDQVSGFLTRRFSKWDTETKHANIAPLSTVHVYSPGQGVWIIVSTS